MSALYDLNFYSIIYLLNLLFIHKEPNNQYSRRIEETTMLPQRNNKRKTINGKVIRSENAIAIGHANSFSTPKSTITTDTSPPFMPKHRSPIDRDMISNTSPELIFPALPGSSSRSRTCANKKENTISRRPKLRLRPRPLVHTEGESGDEEQLHIVRHGPVNFVEKGDQRQEPERILLERPVPREMHDTSRDTETSFFGSLISRSPWKPSLFSAFNWSPSSNERRARNEP